MRRAQDGDSLRSSTLKCRIHSDQSSFVLRCDDSQANFNALSSTCTNHRHSVIALANKGFHFQENKTREKRDPKRTMRQVRNKEREYIYTWRGLELPDGSEPSVSYIFGSRPWKELAGISIPSKATEDAAATGEVWRSRSTGSRLRSCASIASNCECWYHENPTAQHH